MRTKQLFLILALLCTMVQGAWAQASWDEVYAMTNTTSANWTALTEGSSTGKTLGMAGTTTYYYADASLTFSNSTAGGSGLTILGNVYLYLPQGVTVTCTGANANGATGGGAGIELTEGNALYLLGSGTLNATGGNAANGGNGGNGSDADWDNNNDWSGTGGTGGHGGGGAGAGIGTRGGDGGQGGTGAASVTSAWSTAGGGSGAAGQAGATAGAMGELYVAQSFGSLSVTGGAAASQSGSAGGAGKSAFYDGTGYNYTVAGGGGGGAGGFGGAASNIGTGGPGGGGGGGGASGNLDWSTEPGYYVVKAPGGKGGQNADETWAAAGAESIMNHNAIKTGQVKINASGWEADKYNYDSYVSTQAVGTGGSGGAAGNVSTSESAITMTLKLPSQSEWDMVCLQTQTNKSQWTLLPLGARKGATIGAADATTYYFATGDRTFTNSNAGGSGLTILGTVHIFIASGQTITCTGADASAATGAGAGIELTEGNTLCLIGSGKIVATGGNAANGGNGTKGGDAAYKVAKSGLDSNWIKSGDGGRGGDGGGGAGAGIGTRGADGGAGGAGGVGKQGAEEVTGNVGSNGANGGTAADMGTLYVYQMATPTIEAHGGSSGSSGGNSGAAGLNAVFTPVPNGSIIDFPAPAPRKDIHDGSSGTSRSSVATRRGNVVQMGNIYSIGGGGGGGAGGFGGAASDIGSGGPGGGGGGGGASGSITYVYTATSGLSYYQVGALGGKGGVNADGTAAADGEGTMINSEKTNVVFDKDDYKDYTLLGWYNGIDNRAAGGEGANPGAAAQSGTYEVIPAVITLADNADNSTTINTAYRFLANVTLSGRTLYKDGKWNTLCLPFSLSAAQIAAHADFAGATLMTLDVTQKNGFNTEDGTLYLGFKTATEIEAGVPYLVKWTSGDDISNPVFQGVTISNSTAQAVESVTAGLETVQMVGTYSPVSVTADDKSILFLGDANTLYYSTIDRQIRSCRAYFSVPYIKNNAGAKARAFALSFDEEEATGISLTPGPGLTPGPSPKGEGSDCWYTIDGRKLSGKPIQRGMYINKGKKILVK